MRKIHTTEREKHTHTERESHRNTLRETHIDTYGDTQKHTHRQPTGGLLRSGDYQANGGRHGEEKMFVAALFLNPKKLGRQVRSV